ncbi:MAG: hypothetical protein OEO79_15505 [Gemmatimonadota bacterium]|nr:hypothetical protein [Gemmatimonadota bacterium]
MSDDRTELTREELYKLVWSEPMRVLAPRLGISDAGLAKICRRLKVPRPGRGYWQRLRVGKRDRKPPLRSLPAGAPSTVTIGRTAQTPEPEETGPVAERRRFECRPENQISVPDRVGRYHPLVTQTRLAFRAKRALGYQGSRTPKGLDIDVSRASRRRALRIMDTLIKALERRGMAVSVDEIKGATLVDVGGVSIRIGMEERYRTIWLEPTPEELEDARRYGWAPTRRYERERNGSLALRIHEWLPERQRRTWADGKRQRVETCLNAFVVGLVEVSDSKKIVKLQRQERERRRLEEQIQREEQRRRAERERARIEEFRRQVAAWNEVQQSREYLAALRQAMGDADGGGAKVVLEEWVTWAEGYIEGIDPVKVLASADHEAGGAPGPSAEDARGDLDQDPWI